ncbi:hypothetical protein SAMN04487760_10578 [Lachnospiraceae bacterium G41]|nr:hypothetical protein SAMN04487760_10578 [Lachnospiraceae bacterium G41]
MSFDKAEWQYDTARESYCEKYNKNPNSLTDEDEEIIWGFAGNHIALFIIWLIRHDFLGDLHHEEDFEEKDLEAVKNQEKTGMDIFSQYCDMKFTEEDICDEIAPFIEEYYEKKYLNDYCKCIGNEKVLSTTFSWEDYFKLEPVLDEAYKKFLESK